MFSEFSRGYYLGRLYVEPRDGDRAVMHRAQHEHVNEQLYAPFETTQVPNRPVMKLDGQHFPVDGDEDFPPDTLAVPEPFVREAEGGVREVLLAKPEMAKKLLQLSGWAVRDDGEIVRDQPEHPRNQALGGPAVFDDLPGPDGPS